MWTTDGTNPFIQAFTVTFRHECATSKLQATTVPSSIAYVINRNLNQGASTTASVVESSNLSSCTTLTTQIELWKDGQWYTIRDESGTAVGPCVTATGGTDPCTTAAPYKWLTQFDVSAGTADFTVNTNDFDAFDGTDKLYSEYHLRSITRDKWSRDATNPVYQAFSVTINY